MKMAFLVCAGGRPGGGADLQESLNKPGADWLLSKHPRPISPSKPRNTTEWVTWRAGLWEGAARGSHLALGTLSCRSIPLCGSKPHKLTC